MNDSYLADDDFSGVQSEADIQKLLSEAQTPGPSKYNFQARAGEGGGVSGTALGRRRARGCAARTSRGCGAHAAPPPRLVQPNSKRKQIAQEEGGDGYEDMIDEAIDDELAVGASRSFIAPAGGSCGGGGGVPPPRVQRVGGRA